MASVKERLNAYAITKQPQELLALINDMATDFATIAAKHNALATKLDADAGVTDTNYNALHAITVVTTP